MKGITKSLLEKAFRRMGELAAESGLKLEVCLYGGALMMLAYNTRVITKDVDAVLTPSAEGFAIARQVAGEFGLPADWINDDVKVFLAPREAKRQLPWEVPGLMVTAPTAGYLLAMKALACRDPLPGYEGDFDDLRFLIAKMGIRNLEEIQQWIDRYYPDDVMRSDHRASLQLLIEAGNK